MDSVIYWDKPSKCWVMFFTDAEGSQLWDCEYYPNKKAIAVDWWPLCNQQDQQDMFSK